MSAAVTHAGARLDSALVARGLVRSRALAAEAIRDGRVRVDGRLAHKPSRPVTDDAALTVTGTGDPAWVSRSAGKLAPVLERVLAADAAVVLRGARCLDVGASTGGFTQVLLEGGAARVYAVDVGHGQLAASLAADPRVVDLPGLHVRDLTLAPLDGRPVDLAVADVSFISVGAVLAVLPHVLRADGHAVVLVKPQFEAGRGALDKHGVLTDPARHETVLHRVLDTLRTHGLSARGLWASPVTGTHGNREYLLWCARTQDPQGTGSGGPGPRPDHPEHADHAAVAAAVPGVVAAAFGRGSAS